MTVSYKGFTVKLLNIEKNKKIIVSRNPFSQFAYTCRETEEEENFYDIINESIKNPKQLFQWSNFTHNNV